MTVVSADLRCSIKFHDSIHLGAMREPHYNLDVTPAPHLSAACFRRLTSSLTKGASGDAGRPGGGGRSRGLWGADRMMHWSLLMISRSRSKLISKAFSLINMHVGKELATYGIARVCQ